MFAFERTAARPGLQFVFAVALAVLAGCGGKSETAAPATGAPAATTADGTASLAAADRAPAGVAADGGSGGLSGTEPDVPTSARDASRLLNQASFGPTADTLAQVKAIGARKYLLAQMDAPVSRYAYASAQATHWSAMHTSGARDFCASIGLGGDRCWLEYYSSLPVQYEFFRQAVLNEDQLRQRMAFALSQIFVTSGRELDTGYGFALYHQMLRENAFGNFRTVLEKVVTSPFMGAFLNMVDNDVDDPNENFARELLQLFTIGTCELNGDGTLKGGACIETYGNDTVRNYAFALTGWTYPAGGVDPWCNASCQSVRWTHPRYYRGPMVAKAQAHDRTARPLLSGVTAPANRTPQQGLDAVLDSLMAHPNTAPFIGRQLIQFFVTSNPSPAYVGRVARAFTSGILEGQRPIGTGRRGDLRATMAAVLLDPEARAETAAADARFGKLREPVQYIVGSLRALDGLTDGEYLAADWGWSGALKQTPFNAPSVFNYYPPDFPLAGTNWVAPQLGAESIDSTMDRINFANALIYWYGDRGTPPSAAIPGATGTKVSFARWEAMIAGTGDSRKVVDAIDALLLGSRLTAPEKAAIVTAMDAYTPAMTWLERGDPPSNWKRERVKTAFYLIFASPQYQVQR